MKKLALTIGLLAGATAGYAQSSINWTDYVNPNSGTLGPNSGYYITIWGGGTVTGSGNTSSDDPAGTAVYSGTALGATGSGSGPTGYGNGANYTIGLYSASTQAGLTAALVGAPGSTSTFSGSGVAGSWSEQATLSGSVVTVGGGQVWVELAAWYSGGGATTYAQALAANVPVGTSNPGQVTEATAPATPSTLANTLINSGITDFNIKPVPEPSTIALGVVGASAFLMRLRRKV